MGAFKEPHGGELKNLYLDADAAEAEKTAAREYASWDLTERQLCDIELILNGAFSPLDGFLSKDDYETVVGGMRLTSGVLWPMPITLDVSEEFAAGLKSGDKLALRDLGLTLLQDQGLDRFDCAHIQTPRRLNGHHHFGFSRNLASQNDLL